LSIALFSFGGTEHICGHRCCFFIYKKIFVPPLKKKRYERCCVYCVTCFWMCDSCFRVLFCHFLVGMSLGIDEKNVDHVLIRAIYFIRLLYLGVVYVFKLSTKTEKRPPVLCVCSFFFRFRALLFVGFLCILYVFPFWVVLFCGFVCPARTCSQSRLATKKKRKKMRSSFSSLSWEEKSVRPRAQSEKALRASRKRECRKKSIEKRKALNKTFL